MRVKRAALAAVLSLSAMALTAIAPPARAAAPATGECDRACLEGVAEKFIAGYTNRNPAQANLSPDFRYTENGVVLPAPDGLWRTGTGATPYRLYAVEPKLGGVGVFIIAQENGSPTLVALRLQVNPNRQVSEAEAVISRRDPAAGPDASAGQQPQFALLGDKTRPQFLQTIPVSERRSRTEMIAIANSYFTGLENNDGSKVPPFAPDCHRIENGSITTNRPPVAGRPATGANMGCTAAFAAGYYREDTRLRDRRFLVVDEERGLVYAGVFFDHDAVLRNYTAKNGQPVTITRTAPWTWMIHEIFQIRNGQMGQIEAILLSVPYGMRPGWDNGVVMPTLAKEWLPNGPR